MKNYISERSRVSLEKRGCYNFSMQIDKATPENIDAILALQTQIYRVDSPSPSAKEMLENQLKDETCDVLVAKDGAKTIATATIYYIEVAIRARPYALLEGLVVDKDARGKGAGTEIFKKCIEIAKKRNCYKMIFTSGTDRADAHKFYEKFGFKKWGLEFRKDL